MSEGLFVAQEGTGPRVILLHGGTLVGELTWREQHSLAERWTLLIVERAGYGRSRVSPGEDLDTDAALVDELLGAGAHLVGQSTGAVAAMLAAARRPQAVLSLTLCEPPAFQLVPHCSEAQQLAAALAAHLRAPGEAAAWLRGFVRLVGSDVTIPDELPPTLADGVRAVRAVRCFPWEVDLPMAELAAASFPTPVPPSTPS
jgi:pimeloyl-ACP methyl ester carboxylesterase